MGKIRVGLIGIGGRAYGHIDGFLKSPDSEIVALVDTDPARLQTAVEKRPEMADVPAYSDYKDMLAAGGLDAVLVCTPHTLHFQQIMDSFDAGLHVLTEKPMVCSTAHAKDIVVKADKVGKVLMIGYQRHFQSQYRYIKQMVESGKLGEVYYISALQCQGWKKATAGLWRQVPELSGGGQLNDSGSHLLDIILWTSGLAAEKVFATIDHRQTPVDINSSLSIDFTNGARGSITIVGDSTCRWYEDFTIWGTKGTIFYRNGKITYCDENNEMLEPTDMPETGNINQGFCDLVLGKDKNWVPAECGVKVIELTEAAWTSAQTGLPCSVSSL